MKRQRMGIILVTILCFSFIMGYALAYTVQSHKIWSSSRKPALNITVPEALISKDTPVIYEREYTLSNKVLVSEFAYKDDIIGKNRNQIIDKYSPANGFNISWQDQTLLIHQKVNDWSPEDKGKLRFKEYKGMLAVYRGPDASHDVLFKVTSIKYNTLPDYVQTDIKAGKYEFRDEQSLNDALESMDDYN